ncbi:C-type lectin domain family 17, member A-like [Phasianus colchicus]|uniref:C-type lectin domain-containing protein n=1 Tax=Phasianus colchicus TaxID=9054 RepID=A0A669QX43_PHACC|nr:C-type lectin domain family 17, member A-like [Phasianus colchicus]
MAVLLMGPQHQFPSREEPKPQGQTLKWGELEAVRGWGLRLRKEENQKLVAWFRLEEPSMALQETYGNWLGPPPVPAKRPVRQAGIYSAAGKMTPMNDFRPASPDSFADEDDYDDVSVSGSDRGYNPPTSNRDLQSQKGKGGTGVYILAGKPPSSNPSPVGNPKPSSEHGRPSTTILYILVALSFVVWVLLLALAVVKQVEIMAELELLRSNYSETQIHMLQELSESRREQLWLRSGMRNYYRELQDMAARMCKVIPDKKCLAGWKAFEGNCYSFSTERMSWREAKEICDDQGAHLVIINSDREQGFLKNSINSSNVYWLGLTDEQQEGTWLWINGDAVSTSYWMAWQENPDQDQKDCGTMGPNGLWMDERCSQLHHWICEKPWGC